MTASNQRPWRSLTERAGAPPAADAAEDPRRELLLPVADGSRRTFLKAIGFGIASTAVACSRGPVQKAIPYLNPPEDVLPGRAYWMATTCAGCDAGCGVLARCRDGRPVKLEGNPTHPISAGGLCAVGQATVLSLYDSARLGGPLLGGRPCGYDELDAAIQERLQGTRQGGGGVRLLTGTVTGPTRRRAIATFLRRYPGARHIEYDALSASAILDAFELSHGVRALPRYRLDRARCLAAFDADFLGTWISPVEYAARYRQGRDPDARPPRMSRHVQLEARLSLTGSVADRRHVLAPHEIGPALESLLAKIAVRRGSPPPAGDPPPTALDAALEMLADELWEARGAGLVLCGTNSLRLQLLVNQLNEWLDNHGTCVDLASPSQQVRGDDAALAALIEEIEQGAVEVLLVEGNNPAYDLPRAMAAAIGKVPFLVSFAATLDETAAQAAAVCPGPHFLEAWDDAEPVAGTLTLTQPTVPALRDTRSFQRSLAAWCGEDRDDLDLLRESWRQDVFAGGSDREFDAFLDQALHDGFVEIEARRPAGPTPAFRSPVLHGAGERTAPATGLLELVLYPKVALRDGRHAHNPWLQELPDPISKVTWDNYACLAPATAAELGVEDGDVVRLTVEGDAESVELPVWIQAGQHAGTVAVALGYGRAGTDRFRDVGPRWLQSRPTVVAGDTIGRNVAPWVDDRGRTRRLDTRTVSVEATGRHASLACTQDHHSLHVPAHLAPRDGAVRDAVLATTLAQWRDDPAHALAHGHHPAGELWADDHAPTGHHWGLVVDLSACTGCSACVVSCQAENNVPVVGKDEVRRHREMHWLRIDRYHAGEGDAVDTVHQPMMCQHCDHAPCETVCPVLATVHSAEGLNQQVYNRCVGTRYCANNCPYKTRRFNWFDYPHEDRLANLSLNPDVTIRSRGVMEKCSFCYQRILEAKAESRREGRPLADGDVRTACQQSCPTAALTFGDLADPDSAASRKARSLRTYRVLEELNVQPSVHYQAVVRHRDAPPAPEEPAHG